MAFLDRGQPTEGHTLVVPRTHAADIWAISELDAVAVMGWPSGSLTSSTSDSAPTGSPLMQSNRSAAWQDVFHFHLHVIPRWTDDALMRPWRPTLPSDERLAVTLSLLR